MSETCLLCGLPEKGYKQSKAVDFICGHCVQLMLAADRDELRRAYDKAIRLGYTRKASAIETFFVEDEHAEAKKPERGMVRERAMQTVRPSRDQVRA